jgi:predicted CXXCH cytochrome family protein
MTVRILILVVLSSFLAVFSVAGEPAVSVLYPKDHSIVGGKVNVVLDPGADWSATPFFQVTAGKTEYSLVDASSGKHAFQGVDLQPGMNTLTIRVLAPAADKEKKDRQPKYREVSSRTITVFSMVELFTTRYAPAGYTPALFHSRENEAMCGGCHNLEAKADSPRPKKTEDAVCYACHRGIPTGKHIHGPAAVWDCLRCHDPEIYPVKYQFTAEDPWKVTKTVQAVMPVVFTVPNDALFKPGTAVLVANYMKKVTEKGKKQSTTWDLDKLRELFSAVLEHAKLNPGDRVRIEAHTDNTPLPKPKGKQAKGFKDNLALTKARAAAIASLLKQYGVTGKNRVAAVGMGETLPKLPNTTKENRVQNNRVEIVIYPADVKVPNSANLPVLKDRDRVVVNLSYAHGPAVKKLRVVEKVPKGSQYVKGTGFSTGKSREPKIKGDELVWELGNLGESFSETLSYVIKKGKKPSALSGVVAISYDTFASSEVTREFDPTKPVKRSHTVQEACMKCHPGVLAGKHRHGPADAGYCTLCHDPHASPNATQLRKPSWYLCTTCHEEMASGVHVLAGFVKGITHPTKDKRDPARPGKRLSCASCHEPHSAANRYLFAFEANTRNELCGVCHRKK